VLPLDNYGDVRWPQRRKDAEKNTLDVPALDAAPRGGGPGAQSDERTTDRDECRSFTACARLGLGLPRRPTASSTFEALRLRGPRETDVTILTELDTKQGIDQ
jgi:hypothetical protein